MCMFLKTSIIYPKQSVLSYVPRTWLAIVFMHCLYCICLLATAERRRGLMDWRVSAAFTSETVESIGRIQSESPVRNKRREFAEQNLLQQGY